MLRLALAVSAAIAFLAGSPPRDAQRQAARDERVTIASDGWSLAGNLLSPATAERSPVVLLLNGATRDRRAYIPLAQELAARGIASLRLDLRGEGESTNLGRFEPGRDNPALAGAERDVAAALTYLRAAPRFDPTRIGVLGASYSGEAMAAAARAGAPARAYVALSPGSFSDESAQAIDASGAPWWFIASRDERFAQSVVEAIPSKSRTARVTLVDGNAHASDILSPHFLLNGEIADWFAASLRGLRAPAPWGRLPHGAWPVGFRTIEARDASGLLRIDLWYPARTAPAARPDMRFADYLRESDDLRGGAPGFPHDPASLAATLAVAMTGSAEAVPGPVLARLLDTPMAAGRGAPAAEGAWPLALWTPRYGTTAMQAVLSEYLASHGVAVAFARRPSGTALLPFELATQERRAAELAARVGDMRAALDRLSREPVVDTRRIALLAWSYTGEMATVFQQQEPRVSLVAGLSTTLVNDWVFRGADALAAQDPGHLTATYAVLTQPRETRPPLLDRLASSYYIELAGTAHGSFNALEGHLPALNDIAIAQPWSSASPESARGYEAASVIALRLIRHHVIAGMHRRLRPAGLAAGLDAGIVRIPPR